MTEVEQPPQNGIDLSATEDEESSKARPADIEQDMREMERRKRVEAIMSSKLFREELERIVDCARDSGNAAGILQQLSDIVGVPSSRVGSVFKSSTCMLPINDIRGVESMGYAKGEKILRCKLAATFRLLDLYGWTQGLGAQITARLKVDQEYFLVNPYGLLYHEITASSLNKVDMQGNIVEQGTTNFGVNKSHFVLHSVVHAARPDIRCAIYIGCSPVVAISSLKTGLLPLTKDACVLGELTSYSYIGYLHDEEERNKLVRNLGPNSKVMLLSNHGALCCGETIEEAFFAACHIVQACETQLKLLPVGLDNLVLIPEESRKLIYDQSRRPPEDLEKKFAAATISDSNKSEEEKKEGGDSQQKILGQAPKWRVGGAEFEALMRMLDNAGYRTGYIYRHPLIKSEPPKPKNDVELPPAVSSLGYLLEEEELFRQGIWKKGDLRKGGDRSRWLNSPNVYQKVEVLETGTPDPKKITKWVAEGSPTHSTPVRIDDPLQFVPVNTNPKEFKRVQQQIKDNRRADKISAGPQSHILEGVTWDEANRIKDATVSSAGDHVVLMGAASKGIIQRGFQHNAAVYKAPYAKNPFDNVTDDELNEYKRTVERKKKSIHGEYTDTDFSESEALSSLQTSGAQQQTKQTTTTTTTANVSQSEPEDISEHQVMRIQTEQAPVPCQPEVVLSDASLSFINGERSHIAANRKPPTGRDVQILLNRPEDLNIHKSLNLPYIHSSSKNQYQKGEEDEKEKEEKSYNINCQAYHFQFKDLNKNSHSQLTNTLENYLYFQDPKDKVLSTTYTNTLDKHLYRSQGNGNDSSINLDMNNTSINKYLCLRSINPFETHCSNPKVCNEIFKSLLKSESLQNQKVRESNQSEIYLSALYKNCNFTSKTVKIPYRTVSHFGFNSPIREALPKHKHIAINQEHERTYIPMRKSISYEEIFSSPRYINLCESCFELIVRLKPELKENKTKLYNLTDWSYEDSHLTLTPNCSIVDKENQNNITDLDKIYTDFANYLDPTIEIVDTMNHETDKCNVMTSNLNDNVMRVNSFDSDYKNTGNSSNSLSEFKKSENDNIMDYTTETNIIEFNSCFDNAADGLPKRSKQNMEIYNNSVLIKHSNNFPKKISREENPQRKFQFEELLASFRNFDKSRNTEIPMNSNIKSHAYEEFHHIKNVYEENPLFMHALSRNLRQKDLVELNSEFELNYCSFQSLNNQNLEIENKTKEISENLEYIKCSNNNMAENNINLSKLFRSKSTVNCHQNSCIIYSPLELTILHKIHTNKLNKSEKIFEKIENAIRNKIIPTDVDIQMKDKDTYMQRESKENSSDKDCNFSNSTIKKDSPQRSQSITKRKINSSTPKIKLIKTSVENDTCRKQFNNSSTKTNNQSTKPIKTFLRKSNKASNCRNFVLENIRNVSVQHQSPRLNRLKNNSESKTGRNCSSASCENNLSKVFKHTPNERISKKSPYDKTSEIFPFQTKVVQGSPRFWISMSENPLENFEKFSSHLKTADNNCNPLNGSLNMKALDTEVVSKVDEEINALGDEIHQIQPRLEKYKRKLDEFGNRVTNCVNGIKECVTMQENIIGVQKKLRDCINSHQNAESNICRLQTFTLSETED